MPGSAPAASDSTFAGFWSALPSILWVLFAVVVVVLFREQISEILQNLSWRLRTGAALKLFSLELGQSYVSPSIDAATEESALQTYVDNGERWRQREQYYLPNRNVQLVHRVAPSRHSGYLYDIQLYVIPHKNATLNNVQKVAYYFGRHWGNRVFVSDDRGRGFSVTTSAFGVFMCTAKLTFTDGEEVFLNRYVDFEMGAIGSKA